jgi:uncharacterized membrane protein YdjX (TVP38/TMEM64 family)
VNLCLFIIIIPNSLESNTNITLLVTSFHPNIYAVYILATLLFIPGSILTLGAGFVFSMALHGLGVGVLVGTLSVVIGASIGAILAFLLGRYLLLEQVRKLSKKYAIFEALNVALQTNGLKIFILLRYVLCLFVRFYFLHKLKNDKFLIGILTFTIFV